LITKIKNDTLFLRQFVVQQIPTTLGVYILDTVSSYHYQYHYKQIKAIGKTGRKFDVSTSAAVLMGGGILLTAASAVVFLVDREKFSPQLMIGGIVLAGIGYLMARLGGKGMVIGKKYSLVYVEVTNKKG
jgi:multidrug transporter EmrE-like cation transporter